MADPTDQDDLALEQASTVEHEYLNGEIYALAGGTPAHAGLAVDEIYDDLDLGVHPPADPGDDLPPA